MWTGYISLERQVEGSCTTGNYLQNNHNWPQHISQQQRWLPPQNWKGSLPWQENNVHTPSSRKIRAWTQLTRSWRGREWASRELCPKGQAKSQIPSFRKAQEQMGRKAFAWSVPKKNRREGCRPRHWPTLGWVQPNVRMRNLWAISRNSWPPCLWMSWTCQDIVYTKTQKCCSIYLDWTIQYPASRTEIVTSFKIKHLKWFHGQLLWSFAFNGLTTHRTLYELCS